MTNLSDLAAKAEGPGLSAEDAAAAMEAMADGRAAPEEIRRLLLAPSLSVEAVAPEVLAAFARVVRARALPVPIIEAGPPLIDTCGTGGGVGTFNVSTAAALVAAAGGLRVAKHGNRAVASRCGSADVLEALGVAVESTPEAVARSIAETGFGFLFAPAFHRAFAHVAPVRRALAAEGRRTLFNALGPVCNPAPVRRHVAGVFRPDLCRRLARVFGLLGAEHALVVCGESDDGPVDEISTLGPTLVAEWRDGGISEHRIDPRALGLDPARPADVAGGDVQGNAATIRRILAGGARDLRADLVAANAAAALYVGGAVPTLPAGVARAREILWSGEAARVLDRLRALR